MTLGPWRPSCCSCSRPTPGEDAAADLDADTLHGLYELMVVTRRVDQALTNLQRQGELGDASRYRASVEVERARATDPIPRLQAFLQQQGLWDDQVEAAVARRAEAEAARVREAIAGASHGDPLELFEHVVATADGRVEEGRARLRAALRARDERG